MADKLYLQILECEILVWEQVLEAYTDGLSHLFRGHLDVDRHIRDEVCVREFGQFGGGRHGHDTPTSTGGFDHTDHCLTGLLGRRTNIDHLALGFSWLFL